MAFPFRFLMIIFAIVTGVATSYSVFAEDVYDRLDGTGASHKKVDVIEWEGNLEIHVYPKTATAGLGAKLDDRTPGTKVMVIGYRFKGQAEVLVRRAILGVPFNSKLKAFVDPTEKEFDKLALSNQDLPAPWKPYKLDAAPKTWYPDGDERNDADPSAPQLGDNSKPMTVPKTEPEQRTRPRAPASTDSDSLDHYNW
jgi:hypothetical protein